MDTINTTFLSSSKQQKKKVVIITKAKGSLKKCLTFINQDKELFWYIGEKKAIIG